MRARDTGQTVSRCPNSPGKAKRIAIRQITYNIGNKGVSMRLEDKNRLTVVLANKAWNTISTAKQKHDKWQRRTVSTSYMSCGRCFW